MKLLFLPEEVLTIEDIGPSSKLVLLVLLQFTNNDFLDKTKKPQEEKLNRELLTSKLGITENVLNTAIKKLKELGILKIEQKNIAGKINFEYLVNSKRIKELIQITIDRIEKRKKEAEAEYNNYFY
jgi:predicted transcriptional regulator